MLALCLSVYELPMSRGKGGNPLAVDEARPAAKVCQARDMDPGTNPIPAPIWLPGGGHSGVPVLCEGITAHTGSLLLGWESLG